MVAGTFRYFKQYEADLAKEEEYKEMVRRAKGTKRRKKTV